MTVLELMVVLVILSLIGVVVTIQVVQQLDRAKVDVAGLQLKQVENALELFYLDTQRYPTREEGLTALVTSPPETSGWRGPYLKSSDLLNDPWGQPLRYSFESDAGYSVVSLGSDRQEAGEGAAADIASSGG